MRDKLIKIIITGSLFLPILLFGQNRKSSYEIYRPLVMQFKVPRELEDCKFFFASVVASIKDNKIESNLVYSKGCPESLKNEIKRSLGFLDVKSLTKDYFGITPNTNYKIWLPIFIYPDQYSQDSTKSVNFGTIMSNGFAVSRQQPVFLMDALIIETRKAIQ
nr:hypothetical protein [uncultured Chitinophaga sp.]